MNILKFSTKNGLNYDVATIKDSLTWDISSFANGQYIIKVTIPDDSVTEQVNIMK